jgi:membrane protein
MLLLAPLVILVFFAGTIFYSNALEIIGLNTQQLESLKSILAWLIFGVITALTFSAMYKFIPHDKVLYSNAIKAAIPAAIAFTLMNYLYLETQVMVTRLNAVYGVFAAVPLFMIWINVGWYIILIGAELTYAFQRVKNYKIED